MSLGTRTDFYEWTNDVTDELEARAHRSYDGTHDGLEAVDRVDGFLDWVARVAAAVIVVCIVAGVTVAVIRALGIPVTL